MDLNQIKLFEGKGVRSAWDRNKEEWYFSIVDIVWILTEQENSRGSSTYSVSYTHLTLPTNREV